MVRIQLDLPDEYVAELDALMKEVSINTRKELFNNALTLFQWAVTEKKAGRTLASIDDRSRTYKELVMPALQRVRTVTVEEDRPEAHKHYLAQQGV